MGLRKRKHPADMPDDPLSPVLTRLITTAKPVTSAWWMPGAWTGSGCEKAGLQDGDLVEEDILEALIEGSGGAYDVVFTEPLQLIRVLAMYGAEREERWFDGFLTLARGLLPVTLGDLWEREGLGLSMSHVKYLAAAYAHPVSCCWPVDADIYHMHCIVPGKVWCDDPTCTEHE